MEPTASRFETCLGAVWRYEGGFVNDPRDPGGATNLGITLATARLYGLDGNHDGVVDIVDVRNMTREEASRVYRMGYWQAAGCDHLPPGVDFIVFDSAINCGVGRAVKWLQVAAGVKADGIVGGHTLEAIEGASPRILVDIIYAQRKTHYLASPNFDRFGKGWLARLADVRATAAREAAALPQRTAS